MPRLLVSLSSVLEPTRLMATTWISMRPMDYAAFGVPLIHAVERDGVTRFQRGQARREVNVMSDQQRLARSQGQNEALVAAAFVVIRKQLGDYSFACDLAPARLFGKCVPKLVALSRYRRVGRLTQSTDLTQTEVKGRNYCTYDY